MAIGYFVTGTDTGVGKTLVAAALVRAFAARGRSALGMKPVASGSVEGRWEDVEALLAASSAKAPRELVNPYAFDPPIAPHIAASKAKARMNVGTVIRAYENLGKRADVVVVEGVGGFAVPLNDVDSMADVARQLALPIVLVVGMRLGCLNHALLTRQAIAAEGLECAGWVANEIERAMPELEANIATLEARLDCPRLARIPHRPGIAPADVAPLLTGLK